MSGKKVNYLFLPSLDRREFLQRTAVAGFGMALPLGIGLRASSETLSERVPLPSEPAEWTFEAAKRVWKPMTRAVQHVGVPGYGWQAGTFWDGGLLIGPQGEARFLSDAVWQQESAPLGFNLLEVAVGFGDAPKFLERPCMMDSHVKRGLEDGRLPIPNVRTEDGDLVWNETVWAHLFDRRMEEGMKPRRDDLLVVHAWFKVRNTGSSNRTGHLWLHFGDTSQVILGYKAGRGDELGQALPHHFEAPFGIAENRWFGPPFGVLERNIRYLITKPTKGEVLWRENVAPPVGMKNPIERAIEWRVPLAPGQEAECRLIIPYGLVDREVAKKLAGLDADSLWKDVRSFWTGLADRTTGSITTPDTFVNDYLAAVVGQMTQQIAYRHAGGVWMYKTSPNFYEEYWPISGAWPLPALDLRGLTEYTRPVIQSFIDTQSDDVSALRKNLTPGKQGEVSGEGFAVRPGFMGNFGGWTAHTLLMSHGLELWALASHCRITRDREWMGTGDRPPLQAVLDACDWIAVQRRRTMREENGRKVRHWGLLPAAATHDWLSGNTLCNDSTSIFGMIESVRLLHEIGHPRAEEIAGELKEYRNCLRDRYREARDSARRLPMPDGSEIPYVPRDVNELDWAQTDWTYTYAGPIRAGAWGAFDPHDELVDQTLAFMAAGIPWDKGYYLQLLNDSFAHPTSDSNFLDVDDPKAPRHFFWRHYVEYETMWPIISDLFLERDDIEQFFEWLFNHLAIAVHHDFRVGVESLDGAPSAAPGDGVRWMAIRKMFVNERGGHDGSQQSLWFLQAIPRCWLKPGSHLSIQQVGTRFGGHADVNADVNKDGNSIVVTAQHDLVVKPAEILMRLRSGDGRSLTSASVNGAPTEILKGDTIQLPSGLSGESKVVGYFG
jgi:hypothetical protein